MKLLYVVLVTVSLYETAEGKVYRPKRGPPRAGPLGDRVSTPVLNTIEMAVDHYNPVDIRKFQKGKAKVYRPRRGPPDAGPPRDRAGEPVLDRIEMPVDHYNSADTRTFQMRYYSNDQFFEKGGPIFIYLGGEWAIGPNDLMTGQIYNMAEMHSGYMFYTEHRYYGNSLPTEDWSTSNLQYLSADQALEDLAFFIKAKKAEIDGLEDSKVVVIGGSYSATLATWARLKYPHLIDVAYASSAPLRAEADFFEYYEVVNRELNRTSEECVNIIKEAVTGIERLLHTEKGIDQVSSLFSTCVPLTNEDPDKSMFFWTISRTFADQVQYARLGDLENDCDFIQESAGDPIEKLATWNKQFYDEYECMGGYDEYIKETSSHILNNYGERLWMYQSCTEFGFFHTSNSEDQPFGNTFPLALFTQICADIFGEGFTGSVTNAGVERTNMVYGSDKPAITNLVSVHGTADPWHPLGIREDDSSDTVVTIHVEGSSHCRDLSSVQEEDSEQLKAAKLRVQAVISEWISD